MNLTKSVLFANHSIYYENYHVHKLREDESPPNETDDVVILVKRTKHRNESEEHTMERVRMALKEALSDEFSTTTTEQKTIGNALGLNIAGEAKEANTLREILSSLKETCDRTRHEAYITTRKNRAYNKQVRVSRERFACTVKRDKLHNASEADLELIQDGNEYFHVGNCVLDIDIREPRGHRKDVDTLKFLYGLTPSQVEQTPLSSEVIDALDDHAMPSSFLFCYIVSFLVGVGICITSLSFLSLFVLFLLLLLENLVYIILCFR